MTTRIPTWWVFSCLGVLLVAVYWPGLGGSFFFDDGPSILLAPGVQMKGLSWEALVQAWFSGGAGPTGRPIAQLSFALNHYLSGFDAWTYKLSNLFIHGLCGALVYVILLEFLRKREGSGPLEARWLALAVTALWLLHPLQLLPVLHVVQRMTSLSALFLLLAFWMHMVARRHTGKIAIAWMLLAWGVAWPLSILSKETGLLLPLFVLIWEWLLRRDHTGRLDTFAKIFAAAIASVLVGGLIYLWLGGASWLWAGYDFRPFDVMQRLLSEARALWLYVGMALVPRGSALGLYHDDFSISTSWFAPWTTAPAVLGWLGVLWLIWHMRRRLPLAAFGLCWFLIGHLMESTVLPLELVHEHRNYLPLLGLLLALASALAHWVERGPLQPRILVGVTLLATLVCAATTALRAHQYGDELRRTLAEVQHHPDSARSRYNLGMVLASLPSAAQPGTMAHEMANEHLQRASALDPNFKMALLELLGLGCRSGQAVEEAVLAELTARLRHTLFAPADRNVLFHLKETEVTGPHCLRREQVESLFRAALDNPKTGTAVRAMLYSWLADYLWLKERDIAAAKQALSASLALNPREPSNRLKWAQLLWLGNDREAARQLLLELRGTRLSSEERQTLEQLLAAGNIGKP